MSYVPIFIRTDFPPTLPPGHLHHAARASTGALSASEVASSVFVHAMHDLGAGSAGLWAHGRGTSSAPALGSGTLWTKWPRSALCDKVLAAHHGARLRQDDVALPACGEHARRARSRARLEVTHSRARGGSPVLAPCKVCPV